MIALKSHVCVMTHLVHVHRGKDLFALTPPEVSHKQPNEQH